MSTSKFARRAGRYTNRVLERITGVRVQRADRRERTGIAGEPPERLARLSEPRILEAVSPDLIENVRGMYTYSFPTIPTSSMPGEEIERRINAETWFAPFEFDGRLVPNLIGGGPSGHNYKRFMHMFPAMLSMTGGSLDGKSVLDVGCHVGFWSIQARSAGAQRVVGVEAARRSVDVANFVLDITGLDRISYAHQNAYEVSPDDPGVFDVVLYLGLLYHLDKPVTALERLFAVTREIALVDTQVVPNRWPVMVVGPEYAQAEDDPFHSNVLRMVPSRGAVVQMLRYVGFRDVYYVPKRSKDLPRSYLQDRRETFLAVK